MERVGSISQVDLRVMIQNWNDCRPETSYKLIAVMWNTNHVTSIDHIGSMLLLGVDCQHVQGRMK